MNTKLRGWAGDVFTLKVGPDKTELHIPRDVLTMILHSKSALNSGMFAESQTKTFELPDDDPQAVADVLYFTYTGCVPKLPISYHESRLDAVLSLEPIKSLEAYLLAWIVANNYQAEQAANELVDQILHYVSECLPHPGVLVLLGDAGMRDTLLYRTLAETIPLIFARNLYPDELYLRATDEQPTDLRAVLQRLPSEDLAQLVLASRGLDNELTYAESCTTRFVPDV